METRPPDTPHTPADRDASPPAKLRKLNHLLATILPANRFYAAKLAGIRLPLRSLDEFAALPFTTKDELFGDDIFAANLTHPVEHYVRFHRTSGTRGRPLVVLDSAADWQWWMEAWQYVLDAADVTPGDRAFLAFSFGPFVGFWSAFDALVARGTLTIPGGGLSTLARLDLIRSSRATVLLCTPSYALHLAEVAAQTQFDVGRCDVRRIIVAGEPGGSIPAVRHRIETAWNARVIDHAGATEIGPWGFADREQRGLHVIETLFLPEFRSVATGQPAGEGELSELVLTTLGRFDCPVVRYRTGDLVRPTWSSPDPRGFVLLDGGILGRADDMLVVRGVNVFPSAVEQVLREFSEIAEYRITAYKAGEMDALLIEVEDPLENADRIATAVQLRIGLKVEVRCVPLGSLPRFEGKGRRFVDERRSGVVP